MKYYKHSGFYITIISIIYILNIKNLNGINIQCEQCNYDFNVRKCTSDLGECPSYCRPHFYTGRCYDCSGVFKNSDNNPSLLYSIVGTECINQLNDYNRYIVSETNEVASSSDTLKAGNRTDPSTYLGIIIFGAFVYKTCPNGTIEVQNGVYNNCNCSNAANSFAYTEIIFGVEHLRCVNSCPQGYYYYIQFYSNFKCTDLNENLPYNHIRSNNLLTSGCDSDNPYLVNHEKTNFFYCLSECPGSLPFHQNTNTANEKKCLEKCPDNYFYYSDTKECIEKCDNLQSLIDIKTKTFICVRPSTTETSCPSEFPYKYGSSCLRNCSDTNDAFFSSSHFTATDLRQETYSLITSDSGKWCVKDCKEANPNDGKIYHEKVTFTCVSNCTETSRKYIENDECVKSCNNYHNYDSFECIDECTGDYKYQSIHFKTCYKDCSKLSPIFYYFSTPYRCENFCGPLNFIYKKKNGDNSYSFYCLNQCNTLININGVNDYSNTNYVHRYNDRICLENCTANSYTSSYYHIQQDNVCYQSCDQLNEYINHLTTGNSDYKYEFNSRCYEGIDTSFENKLHYTMKSGIIKYKESTNEDESELNFCSKAGFYYIDRTNNECKNCDRYKIPYSLKSDDGSIEKLGECLNSCNVTYPYYNEVDKLCQKNCYLKILKNVDDSSLGTSDKGNCVSECPTSVYIYESSDGTHCYNKCPSTEKYFYKIGEGKYKCVKDCTTISKFYIENENGGECLDKCGSRNTGSTFTYTDIQLYVYYIPGNTDNKCLKTCKYEQSEFPFSLPGTVSDPQPCLKECPLRFQYYKDADNICLSSCPKYFDSEKKCIDSCPSTSNPPDKFIINEKECSDTCTKNATFIVDIGSNEKKCSIQCHSLKNLYYEVVLSNGDKVYQCTDNCQDDSKYQLEYGSKCIEECPEETFEKDYKCNLKCQDYFKRDENDKRKYKCIDQCDPNNEYIGSNKECISECPRQENFVNSERECKNYCENNYEYLSYGEDEFGSYTIYQCKDNCNGKYILDGTKECVSECTEDKPYLLGNVCVSICLKDQIKPFSATIYPTAGTTTNINKICAEKCSNANGAPKYYGDDKICVDSCNIFENKKYHNEKENDYACVSHCDLKSENRFTYYDDINDKYYCLNSCEYLSDKDNTLTKKIFYSTDDYICNNTCNDRNIFLIPDQHICTNKCPDNLVANPTSTVNDQSISQYKCEYTCKQGTYYYENERICGECQPSHYIIQGTQKCIEFCDQIISQKNYYSYEKTEDSNIIKNNTCVTECPEDKPFVDYNKHCSVQCTPEYKFYKPSEKKCMDKCPNNTLTNGDKCVEKCPKDKVEDSIAKVCLDDCFYSQRNYIYYYESERVCLQECRPGDFIYIDGNNYKCMSNCSNINEGLNKQLYIDGNKCVETCSDIRKFFVNQTTYGEVNISKYCLTDCPIGFEFYKYDNFECSGICYDYYIRNKDPNVIGKVCVKECNNIYPYILIHNNTHKECVEFCPEGKMFYEEEDNGKKTCYEKCPPSSPFHKKGVFKCQKECESGIANKKTMECVTDCELNQFWAEETQNSKTTKMCYDNCNQTNYAQFSTFEKKCVKQCDETNEFLQGNLDTHECECRGLYFINDKGIKQCLDPKIKLCTETNSDYTIQVNGTNQCTKICFGVLSVDGDVCYWGSADSIKCPENSMLGIFDGDIKCECQYGFYTNLKGKKVCLDKTLKCPDYKYFNTQTRECVQTCGDLYLVDGKCYSYCPTGMIPSDGTPRTCTCVYNFYKTDEDKYVCLQEYDQCPFEYPYLIVEKKECVKECSKEYPILYDMKCRSNCEENYHRIKDPNNPDKYICVCDNIWYYELDKSICDVNNHDKTCKKLNMGLNYTVVKTKQCVSSCKGDYQYFFNKKCYYNCSEEDLVKDPNSNECKCKGKWRLNENNEIECIAQNCNANENLLTETNQCIPKTSNCSFDKPLFWNNLCYKECPSNTVEDSIKGNTCKCRFNWFIRNDNLIECMEEGVECPYDSHPYLIYQTKKCVKTIEDCADKYIFNFVCYDKCPDNSIKSADDKNCECDSNAGYWAKGKDTHGRDILECGISSCDKKFTDKKKYDNDTKECVSNCEIPKYLYLDICYSSCPSLTEPVINEYNCKLRNDIDNPDLKVLLKNVEDKINEINENIPKGGIVIKNEENEATVQVYRLEDDEKKNKEALLRSNLAYVDISECIAKIRKNNNMKEGEQVIMVKLDLKSKSKKLIVNPVEYEFRSSITGALLDASVCERNEVVVSYPLTYLFKNRKKLRLLDDEEMIEIAEKFERGKLLYQKDNFIDSFNYNSTIYSDICYPIEVDGKDLTLENRISYFYPNYSFCESSCLYDYTDFMNERIFCNCSIKLKLDVDRPQGVKLSEYNKEETDSNQMGPTNLPAFTCLSKVKISGNPAFIICLIFFIVQLGLLFIIIFKGLSSLITNINKKLYKEEDLNESNVDEDFKMNIKKNKEIDNGKTSERKLNNPPKKNNYVDSKNIVKAKNPKGSLKIRKIYEEKNKFDALSDENKSEEYYNYLKKNEIDTDKGFFTSVKKEEKYLRENFSVSMTKDKFDIVVVILTSIFDKIYLSKVLLFSSKYQITSLMFSLYLLCHLLLLTLCALFFDIKTISKIFEKENYPNLGYYILYGFLGNLIVWAIFKLFYCLIDNSNNIRKLFKKHASSNNLKKMAKLNKLISVIKKDIVIYLVIEFVLIVLCSLYLIAFCGVYTGTKSKLFLSYAFALVTIVIIKIIYGFILGILRKISLFAEKSGLYNVVLIFNKYIS